MATCVRWKFCYTEASPIRLAPPLFYRQQAEQKSVAVLDKKICEALSFADEVVDAKKDDTIEAVVSVKKAINTLGLVQSVVVRRPRLGGTDLGIGVLTNAVQPEAISVNT